MAREINLNRTIWEGWTARDFVKELSPQIDMIMSGKSWQKPFETKEQLKEACRDMQPYYKKNIPEVIEYFAQKYNLK